MSFFNSKQDVIDIKLTKHGKKLLSNGVFQPVYYSFFDDDIIYDSKTYGEEELQNDTEKRILYETPYLKITPSFFSCTTNINEDRDEKDESSFFGIPLNSSDDSINYVPSYDISFKGCYIDFVELTSSNKYDKYNSEFIPQIYLKDQNVVITIDKNYSNAEFSFGDSIPFDAAYDDTYVKMNVSKFVFDILEENVNSLSDNFDIEVHKIENDNLEILSFSPLLAKDVSENIENDILLDSPYIPFRQSLGINTPIDIEQNFTEEDKKMVEYYFDIELDNFSLEENEIGKNRLYIYDNMTDISPKGNKC